MGMVVILNYNNTPRSYLMLKPLHTIGLFTPADLLCIIAVLAILLLCA